MVRRISTALALSFLAVVAASADTPALDELLVDQRERWRVSILRFKSVDLASRNEYLTSSLPRLFREDMADIEEHVLSGETVQGYRRWLIEQAQLEIGKRLTRARTARDDLLFERLPKQEYQEKYQARTEEIRRLTKQLAELDDYRLQRLSVVRRKPVAVVTAEGQLFTGPDEDVASIAEEEDLDLVIWGTLEQLEEYVYLEVFAWDRFKKEERSLGATAARPEELFEAAKPIRDAVARTMLGRDWAHVAVDAPPGSSVSVNGELVGIGSTEARYLPPGDAEIVVEQFGYEPARRVITLLPFATSEVAIDLEDADTDAVLVTSKPSAADVYVRSVWTGRTPVSVPRPSVPSDITLSLSGYRDDSFVVSPTGPAEIHRNLVALDRDWQRYISRRRRVFYSAFGAFSLSVPIPVVFGALFDDAAARFAASEGTADYDELSRLARRANTYYYTRYAGLAVSAGLLVNTLWQLAKYIRAAQYQPADTEGRE